jgi:uncharacterized repeat protein (TIGR03803 family)
MEFARVVRISALVLATSLMSEVVAAQSALAPIFTVLYNFTGSSDGAYPSRRLVRDKMGNLYGTTFGGGTSGVGTVFKVDASGTETVLHNFTDGSDGAGGFYPEAGLIRDSAGNLYGTTSDGGTYLVGTVFKLDTSGTETVLYSFGEKSPDGYDPDGVLIRDKAGNLYGTTPSGGDFDLGTVFKVDASGTETVLHSFAGGASDGKGPVLARLLMGSTGNLYGVTHYGGTSDTGVVYKLGKKGKLTVLHNFTGGTTDGCYPFGAVVMDKNGNLYGTTTECGDSSNSGTVWKLSKKGTETVLHNFSVGPSDGRHPLAGVIMDTKGILYGETQEGGAFGFGTVYKLNKKGRLTLLHSFDLSDGQDPEAELIRDAKGNLYGTAEEGGTGCCGTVWKIQK